MSLVHPLLRAWHGLEVPVGPGGDRGQGSGTVLQELPTCQTMCLSLAHTGQGWR